jgi:outer membrane receptor protein involved in Fe transport
LAIRARSAWLLTSALAGFGLLTVGSSQAADAAYQFDIPAETLSKALADFSQNSPQQIIFSESAVQGLATPGVHGKYAPADALRILLAGTDLDVEVNASGVLMVRQKKVQAASTEGAAENLETVVVTGTNIRGAANASAPLSSYTRDQIDATGLGSIAQFVRRLPENFGGGASDETVGTLAGGGNAVNEVSGSGVNLRGLGSDSTLVLVDGHRIAPGNTAGNFVDLSMIPLSALSRIDVLPDGASAIYGSDAVGGVMNLVLRHDFDGAETRARFSTTTDGGGNDEEVAQTFGHTWDGGSALITYDFDSRGSILSRDRDYASSNANPFTLVPAQGKNALFATANQSLTDDINLFAEGFWSHRSSDMDVTYVASSDQRNMSDVANFGGTFGLNVALPQDREFEISTTFGASNTDQALAELGTIASHTHTNATVTTLDAKFDGTLLTWAGGPIRFALGGQYRHETFDSKDLIAQTLYSPTRDIAAGFVEVDVPLIGPAEGSTLDRLGLSLADRYEHYSDFGSTNNPKFGLNWRPTSDLNLRGTYGTSFRAPLLNDLNPIATQVVALQEFDPTINDAANVLIAFGGNPNLKPETSKNWTLGADWIPDAVPGLKLSTTYYNIRFSNLITTAQLAGFDLFNALVSEQTFGPLIQRNPGLSEVTHLVSSAQEFDDFTFIPGGVDLSTISAIIDSRSTNLSVLNTNGLDFKGSYDMDLPFGHLEAGLDGTYILTFKEKVTSATPSTSVLSTQYNPVDLKLRGRLLFTRGNLEVALFANYTDAYQDVRVTPVVPIASWTTFDLGAQYTFDDGAMNGLSAGLNIINIADTSPPFVATPAPGLAPGLVFDGANANVWGRIISLQLTKRW